MLTTGLNALALVRFGGLRLAHSGGRDGLAWLLMGLAAIGVAVWAVARDAPDDAHSDAQDAANHARSHSVYDGSSGLWALRRESGSRLLSKGIGSKVERFRAATCIESGVGSRSWRYP
jgi:hypothetical protein